MTFFTGTEKHSSQSVDWDASGEKDTARPYAEMLVKETATLHKVLSKYLSQQTVEVSGAATVAGRR